MFHRILVPLDGSETSKLALQYAITTARARHALIRIVHVVTHLEAWPLEGHLSLDKSLRENGTLLLDEAAAFAKESGVEVEIALLESKGRRPSAVIVEAARDWPADVLVMGSSGRGSVDKFIFGSVAEGVLRSSSVPVLLLPRDSE